MRRLIAVRLVNLAILMVGVSIFIFMLSRITGDPRNYYLDNYATKEQYEAWGREMGLDKPLPVQYLIWASKAVRGEFGRSLRHGREASEIVLRTVPATLQLASVSFVFMLVLAVPFGVLSAVKRGTTEDYGARTFALVSQALPAFWIGVVLILIFSVWLGWLPVGGRGDWRHFILPAITLGSGPAAGLLRLVRSSMLEVLDSEYVKLARAKGVPARTVVWKHAFRNALIPPLTYSGLIIAGFITGTVVTETVFAWPGLGRLAVNAIFNNDFPIMSAVVLFGAAVYILTNLLVDITYALVDPRIRYD